jgi:hypothetical protein
MTTTRPKGPATPPCAARAAPGRGERREAGTPAAWGATGKACFRQRLVAAGEARPDEPRAAARSERGGARTREPAANEARPTPREAAPPHPGEPAAGEPPRLEPFRVLPALLGPAERPVGPSRAIEQALEVAGELVESMRVGRLATGEHVISLRLKRGDGSLGVQLVDEGGRVRVRLSGADGAEGARLCEALRADGIEAELDDG